MVSSSKIEESKKKLALAFERLEIIIESKLDVLNKDSLLSDISALKAQIKTLEAENKTILKNYHEVMEKYNQIKRINNDVVEELDTSISFIEQLLENENADS